MTEPTIPQGVPTHRPRGAGGTPGGLGTFFGGLGLLVFGGYLLLSHVQVTSSFGAWGMPFAPGGGGFGPLLIVVMVGVGVLFFNGKSIVGWLLAAGGLVATIVSVIMNLRLWYPSASLLYTLLVFGSIAAGLGLIVRSLRSYPEA